MRRALHARRAALIAGLLALAGLAGPVAPASTAQAGLPAIGVHLNSLSEFEAQRMALGGVDAIRFTFQWRRVQPELDGDYDWSRYDRVMWRAARYGFSVLPIIIGSPTYAARNLTKPPHTKRDMRRYRRFLTAAAARYGEGGQFWRQNPDVPERPIRAWQAWNEPNLRGFSAGRPSPMAYMRLLKVTRRGLRRGDPSAAIVLAGMPETKENLPASEFLRKLYRVRGFRRMIDAVAVHPYAVDEHGVVDVVRRVRQIMGRNGHGRLPLWITEFGWATGGPPSGATVTAERQAELLTRAFELLSRRAQPLGIGPAFWFAWRDTRRPDGWADHFSYHSGLFTLDRNPKPAWDAFTRFTGSNPGVGPIPPNTDDLGLFPRDVP